jgi:hypothetical protein
MVWQRQRVARQVVCFYIVIWTYRDKPIDRQRAIILTDNSSSKSINIINQFSKNSNYNLNNKRKVDKVEYLSAQEHTNVGLRQDVRTKLLRRAIVLFSMNFTMLSTWGFVMI